MTLISCWPHPAKMLSSFSYSSVFFLALSLSLFLFLPFPYSFCFMCVCFGKLLSAVSACWIRAVLIHYSRGAITSYKSTHERTEYHPELRASLLLFFPHFSLLLLVPTQRNLSHSSSISFFLSSLLYSVVLYWDVTRWAGQSENWPDDSRLFVTSEASTHS